ncbi:MAG: SH3 domain-containing protein [Cyanobacteria bacterium P01_H01_bin.74]
MFDLDAMFNSMFKSLPSLVEAVQHELGLIALTVIALSILAFFLMRDATSREKLVAFLVIAGLPVLVLSIRPPMASSFHHSASSSATSSAPSNAHHNASLGNQVSSKQPDNKKQVNSKVPPEHPKRQSENHLPETALLTPKITPVSLGPYPSHSTYSRASINAPVGQSLVGPEVSLPNITATLNTLFGEPVFEPSSSLSTTELEFHEAYHPMTGAPMCGQVNNLLPPSQGDGFLAVRSAPSTTEGRRIYKLRNNDIVALGETESPWIQVMVIPSNQNLNGLSTSMPIYGWSHSRWIKPIACHF